MLPARLRFTLPRSARVRSRNAFQRVLRRRLRASDARLTLYIVQNDGQHVRLGISIGRRVGNAVRRNRWKRLVREAFRLIRHELPAGLDVVIIPKPGVAPTVPELQHSIRRLIGRLRAGQHRPRPTQQAGTARDPEAAPPNGTG